MQYEYEPETEGFTGKVTIEAITTAQRYRYLYECGFETDKDGNVKGGMNNLPAIATSIEKARPHVKKVDLVHEESGDHFDSFDKLNRDNRCDALVNEIASKVIQGAQLSKNSK